MVHLAWLILTCLTSGIQAQLEGQTLNLQRQGLQDFVERWSGPRLTLEQAGPVLLDAAKPRHINTPGPQANVPVLLVPPLTGVQLDVQLSKPSRSPHIWCSARSDWKELWISPEIFVPGQFSCIAENLRIILDPATNLSHSLPGVTIRPNHGFDVLKPSGLNPITTLLQTLEQRGWLAKQLQSHIYDWRLAPADWAASDRAYGWADLKRDIESLSSANDGRPVALVGISMGAPYASAFLSSGLVDDNWKARHVAALFSVSGVFGGAPVATWDTISARLQGLEHVFPKSDIAQLMRAFPALSWLAPTAQTYGDASPVIVNTARSRNYTAALLGQALQDAGADQAATYWHISRPYSPTKAPGVRVFCMVSRGLSTPSVITYKSQDFSDDPEVQFEDGDMTVPTQGLTAACEQWAQLPGHPPVTLKTWLGIPHAGILMTRDGLAYFLEQLDALSGVASA